MACVVCFALFCGRHFHTVGSRARTTAAAAKRKTLPHMPVLHINAFLPALHYVPRALYARAHVRAFYARVLPAFYVPRAPSSPPLFFALPSSPAHCLRIFAGSLVLVLLLLRIKIWCVAFYLQNKRQNKGNSSKTKTGRVAHGVWWRARGFSPLCCLVYISICMGKGSSSPVLFTSRSLSVSSRIS